MRNFENGYFMKPINAIYDFNYKRNPILSEMNLSRIDLKCKRVKFLSPNVGVNYLR